MIEASQLSLFDYASLDDETVHRLKQNAQETRSLLKRTSDDIIQIGRNLLEAKAALGHGKFIPWVIQEIGISQKTSWRFMQIAQGKSVTMTDLPVIAPVEPIDGDTGVRFNRMTKEEKRQKVKDFFVEFPQLHALSNREIAKRCGVDETLVRTMRRELFPTLKAVSVHPAPPEETPPEPEGELQSEPGQIEEEKPKPEPKPEIPVVPEPPKLPKIEASEAVQLERDIRREAQQERNEHLREKGVDLPQDTYACLVIDPPWQMEKIERDERPNQFAFDYPTMTEDELKKFPLPAVAANDCHLYLWATQKYLPLALRLAEYWGFKYQCLLTWVKNVGFTPFSWMYSTEHVLFCTKGNLPLLTIGRRLDFSAKVREHSRKPDEFYEIVREVSPGPRLDIFSREKRDGFEQYGNEVEKFVVPAR